MSNFGNKVWEAKLRRLDGLGDCRFPATTEIQLGGDLDDAKVLMTAKGLKANMQSDAAAFEAWCLALLRCGAKTISVGLADGAVHSGSHHQRFLYRLARFKELFDQEIGFQADLQGTSTALNPDKIRLLNQPNPRPRPAESERETRFNTVSVSGLANASETDLEKALEVSPAFKARFGLDAVIRQWPVGLFENSVKRGAEIFTGGKSAIDLLGVSGDTLVLFELKKQGNRKAGVLSELLFYTSVMRDALGENAAFGFERQGRARNCAIGPADVARCRNIRAVLLAPTFHPLVEDKGGLSMLNARAGEHWSEPSVTFELVRIEAGPATAADDFRFSPSRRLEAA